MTTTNISEILAKIPSLKTVEEVIAAYEAAVSEYKSLALNADAQATYQAASGLMPAVEDAWYIRLCEFGSVVVVELYEARIAAARGC
jgi:hypothetical protein